MVLFSLDVPSEVVRRPLQPKRDTIPDGEVHGGEEAHEERKVDEGRADLERVARPAVAERGDDGDGVDDGWVGVYLGDGVAGPLPKTRRKTKSKPQ